MSEGNIQGCIIDGCLVSRAEKWGSWLPYNDVTEVWSCAKMRSEIGDHLVYLHYVDRYLDAVCIYVGDSLTVLSNRKMYNKGDRSSMIRFVYVCIIRLYKRWMISSGSSPVLSTNRCSQNPPFCTTKPTERARCASRIGWVYM